MSGAGSAGRLAAIVALVAFSTAPFAWSVVTSVKPAEEVFAAPPTYLPREWTVESYRGVFTQRPFGRYLLNSVVVGLMSTAIAVIAGGLAGFGLASTTGRAVAAVRAGLLFFAVWPPAVLLVPLYTVARSLGLANSHVGLAFIHATLNLPFAVWMLGASFAQLPRELEEAAWIDGFSRVQFLTRVALPLAAPGVAATAILVFIFSWNEFVMALTLLTRDELRTVPVGIALLTGATTYEVPWGQVSAAVVLTTLPVMVAVLSLQRWIVGGLTAGAVKG